MPRCFLVLCCALTMHGATAVRQFRPHDFSYNAKVNGNPFEVELHAEFAGPDGARLRVPGFYDGNGTWKIRFMAPHPGAWTMRTVSPVAALHGKTEQITASANISDRVHGRLRIDPDHPYHFRFEDGTRFFLMGYEADWLGLAGLDDPERTVMRRTIAHMDHRGFNYVLVNVYAHDTRWAPGKSCDYDHGPPAMYVFGGTNEKPDHTRLNTAFFRKYDEMMQALLDRGIVAHMMLKVYNKSVKWPANGTPEERQYFRYVTARYQAFPNLVWDFSKESFKEPDDKLQRSLIDLVRSEDAYGHLTTAHDDDAYEWDPELSRNLDFRMDQYHEGDYAGVTAFDRAMRKRPVVNAEFGYEYGVENLPTHTHKNQSDWKEFLRRAYVISLAGGYVVYYYNNTAWDVLKPDPEPPGMARWQTLKNTLSSLPYWRMEPCADRALGGPALCGGGAMAAYVPGGSITLNLRVMESAAQVRWVNTWTGESIAAEALQPKVHRLLKPKAFADAPAVVIVSR